MDADGRLDLLRHADNLGAGEARQGLEGALDGPLRLRGPVATQDDNHAPLGGRIETVARRVRLIDGVDGEATVRTGPAGPFPPIAEGVLASFANEPLTQVELREDFPQGGFAAQLDAVGEVLGLGPGRPRRPGGPESLKFLYKTCIHARGCHPGGGFL